MSQSAKVQSLINKFANELHDLILVEVIEVVTAGLGGKSSKGAVVAKGTAPRALKKGAKRSPEALQELTDDLYGHIKKHPGQRIEQIGVAMDVSTKSLNLPVKKLLADKKVATKGVKRATTYFAK